MVPAGAEAALKAVRKRSVKSNARGRRPIARKAYVAAIAAFYKDYDKVDTRPRAIAYGRRWSRFTPVSHDQEAGVFYSRWRWNATQPPTDKSFATKDGGPDPGKGLATHRTTLASCTT